MSAFRVAIRIWFLSFVVCAVAATLSFLYADMPISLYCAQFFRHLRVLGEGLGSAVILSGEAVAVTALVLARLIHGKLPPPAEALAVACLTSICAYAIDSNALKLIFGVPNPVDVLHGAEHVFNFWMGSTRSSFPSSHMALAAAFAGVYMRLYRSSIWPLSLLLLLAAGLLIVGEWHFLSDVIAGAFLGMSAGLLAGELWDVHSGWDRPQQQ
jgi:membrane-associated phospholipid phosphatase